MPIIDAGKLRAVSLSTPIKNHEACVSGALAIIHVPIGIGSTALEELEWFALYPVSTVTQRGLHAQPEGIATTYPALEPDHIMISPSPAPGPAVPGPRSWAGRGTIMTAQTVTGAYVTRCWSEV